MWNIYTNEYFSTIKENEIMLFIATRMTLEIIILSEVSQIEKYHVITYMQNQKKMIKNELTYRTEIGSQTQKICGYQRKRWGGIN